MTEYRHDSYRDVQGQGVSTSTCERSADTWQQCGSPFDAAIGENVSFFFFHFLFTKSVREAAR